MKIGPLYFLDAAAVIFTADKLSGRDGPRILRALGWMVAIAFTLPGALLLALIPYAIAPLSLVILASPFFAPLLIGLTIRWLRRSSARSAHIRSGSPAPYRR